MGKIIDAHCHLEHLEASELPTFFSSFETNDMACVVASATERNNWDFYKKLEQEHPKQIKICYGIHPLAIDEFWETDLNRLEQYLPQSIAVGEIGLDFHKIFSQDNVNVMKLQMKVFERQIRLAQKYNKPIVVHCREAFRFIREILIYTKFDLHKVAFHCFVEDVSAAQWILSNGGHVSYSGILTFNKPGHTLETAQIAPLSQIFIETDSPYLAPTPFRGKQNSPFFVRYVAEKLAEIKQISFEDCVKVTAGNVHRFFKF